MKTKVLILIGILIIALAAVVAPVMAATTTITGNPTKTISVTAHGGITDWVLSAAASQPIHDTNDVTLDVSSNARHWYVNAADLDLTKPSRGFMVDWGGAAYDGTAVLANALGVQGTATASQYTATAGIVTLSGSDQLIYQGVNGPSGTGTFNAMPLDFSQTVLSSDASLTGTDVYRIVVTFTGVTP